MTHKFGRVAAVLLATTFAGTALAQEVTVVLSEELDIVDPCEASRSNLGRVILQNISETITEMVPGTGLIPNNYLYVLDPRPDHANSMAPGKRVTSSMAPLMVVQNGQPRYALGLPGGLRIFPSALQALINLIDTRTRPPGSK